MLRRITTLVIAMLILAILVGLLALDYSAGAAVAVGVLASLALWWLAARLWGSARAVRSRPALAIGCISTLCVSLLASFLWIRWPFRLYMATAPEPPLVESYQVTIQRADGKSGDFLIKETVTINPKWVEYAKAENVPPTVELPERKVTSADVGLLTREVRITPVQANSSAVAVLTLPDGRTLTGRMCYSCENASVTWRDAPSGSFLGAKDAEGVQKYPYLNTETVSWSVINLEQGVTFAFVPPPFQYVKPVIQPLLGASSLDKWVLGILGLVGTLVISPIVRPVISSALQKRFGSWFEAWVAAWEKKAKPQKKSKPKEGKHSH